MKFSVEWQDDAPNLAPEERATVAAVQIFIDDSNACFYLDGGQSNAAVRLPVYALAEGLALDWWSLFGGRDSFISLMRYRSGFAVPDIRLSFDGAAFDVWAEQRVYTNPDIRFWTGQREVMTRENAEQTLSEFIDAVLDRLSSCGVADTTAALRWARVQASRLEPDEMEFCEAAGAMGVDPYQVPDADADAIETAATIFTKEPLTEFLAGARGGDHHRLLEWVRHVESRPHSRSRVAELPAIARQAATATPVRDGERGWALGYRRARAFRRVLNLGDNARFTSYRHLATKLGAGTGFAPAPPVDGIRLLRADKDNSAHLHLRKLGPPGTSVATQLFTFGRGVGDAACFPEPQTAPVNDLRSAHRQQCGRAFAAEFLAPIAEILSMRSDGRDIPAIAEEFAVSPAVINHQIENRHRIEAA